MKQVTISKLLGVAAISITLLSCNEATQPEPKYAEVFQVHLQSYYSQTPVEVKIDNSEVFSGTISTGAVLGFARIVPLQVMPGVHSMSVNVAHALTKDTSFTLSDSLYVGVGYDAVNPRITFVFQRERFAYD